jgi:hypothetical protein
MHKQLLWYWQFFWCNRNHDMHKEVFDIHIFPNAIEIVTSSSKSFDIHTLCLMH